MRLLGHPVHPMLIVFPIGLLVTGTVFDAIDTFGGSPVFGQVGFWNIAAGLIGVVLAASTGLLDWLRIPAGTRAKRVGLLHAGLNSVVGLLFLISWLVRLNADTRTPGAALLIMQIVAVVLLGASGWLGGELVDRMGVGVDAGAHADSPSSLSDRPASERVRHDRGRPAHA
jgi:uncharacterized membrane protein